MINRVFIKDLLSFEQIDLEFDNSLVVITGPSGAGKELDNELIVKSIKKDRARFFLNEQNISKKALKELFGKYVSYISVRDKSGFESQRLLEIIDSYITDSKFIELKKSYFKLYEQYIYKQEELKKLKNKIQNSIEREEFLKYEIDKIEKIAPKEGEYEEFLKIKKQLSKIDKINEITSKIGAVFDYEDLIYELFEMLDKDSSYLSDALNSLRADIEDVQTLSEDLADINIEEVLDRLQDLDSLIKRFGSISQALQYLQEKKEELASFESVNQDFSAIEEFIKDAYSKLNILASQLSNQRQNILIEIETEINSYLKELKLGKLRFNLEKTQLHECGFDEMSILLDGVGIESLSGGEFNRVRLALLTVAAQNIGKNQGVIILDEIDANVSGDESIAIANMISKLSKSFQIFAISHQPHLSSKANSHILITKQNGISIAQLLDNNQRVQEIARIIGGVNYNKESWEFAKKLMERE